MAGSPPASVRVPATVSSSTKERSQLAKLLSSKRDLTSAPSREDAPASTIRWESLVADMITLSVKKRRDGGGRERFAKSIRRQHRRKRRKLRRLRNIST